MIVAWQETRGGLVDIYAKGLDGTGNPRWPTIAVCTATGNQESPAIASDGSGGAIITWEDYRSDPSADIYAQRVLASGTVDPTWPADGRALCAAASYQAFPAIVSDGSGGAIVAWEDYRSSPTRIYAERVLASGATDPAWPVNGRALSAATGSQTDPGIVSDGAGGAIVTWTTSSDAIYAQRVLTSGAVDPAWPANGRALCTATNAQIDPAITTDGAGGAIVTWTDHRSAGIAGGEPPSTALGLPPFTGDIYAQRVLASGAVDPAWPADGRAVCIATLDQAAARICPDGAGGAIIAWEDYRNSSTDVYAQRVLASGEADPAWPADGRALCNATNYQLTLAIVADGAGGAIVTWEDFRTGAYDVYGQRVLAGGTVDPGWPADGQALCTASGAQRSPAIVPDGSGGAIVAWQDNRDANPLVYAARVSAAGIVLWAPDGVTPVLLSLVSAEAGPGAVRLVWHTARAASEFTLYRSEARGAWAEVSMLTPDGSGLLRFVDETVLAGKRYGYRLGVRPGGNETSLGEVWVEVPGEAKLEMEGPRPNPALRDLVVAFSLAEAGDVTLELLDVAGRRVLARRFTGLYAGTHVLNLSEGWTPPTGTYIIRLTQAGRSVTRKAVVAR